MTRTGRDASTAVVRSPEAVGYFAATAADEAEYARALAEARRSIPASLGPRCAVMVVAQDRPGLVFDVADALRSVSAEVEGASHATLGGCSALSFVVSSTAAIDREALQSKLNQVPQLSCDQAVFAPLPWQRRPAPPAEYSRWNLYGTAPDQPGMLHAVASALARSGGLIVRFLSLVINGTECVVDLAVALPPSARIGSLVTEVSDTYVGHGGALRSFSQYRPGGDHSLSWLTANQAQFEDALLLSIVGEASRGLIASVTADIHRSGHNIVGSSMDVLRGHTVALLAVTGSGSSQELYESVANSSSEYRLQRSVCRPPEPAGPPAGDTLCYVSLLAPRGDHVLASAALAFKEVGANVERLRADLTSDPDGTISIDAYVRLAPGMLTGDIALALASKPVEWLVPPDPVALAASVLLDLLS